MTGLFGNGAYNKRIGEFLFYDKSLLSRMIQCYFMGDGCVGRSHARCETISRTLAYEIHFALLRFGIFSHITVSNKGRKHTLYSVQVSRASLDKFMLLYTNGHQGNEKIKVNHYDRSVYALYKQRIYSECEFESDVGEDILYNISVEEDESYIIQGSIVVHNCKNAENWSVHKWIIQARKNKKKDSDWLLFCRRNYMDPIVIMDAETFFNLYKKYLDKGVE
jgi:intein/homing endonuclease